MNGSGLSCNSFLKDNFIYFWLHQVFIAPFSTCSKQGLLFGCGAWASHCGDLFCCGAGGLGCLGFSSWAMWVQYLGLPGSRAQAQWLWHTGLVPPWPVGSSWTRDWTCVPCIGRWILYHWATREALPQTLRAMRFGPWGCSLLGFRL